MAAVLLSSLCIPQICMAEKGNIEEGTFISREEAAESLAEMEGITYDEALQNLIDSEEELIAERGFKRRPRTASISYKTYTAEYPVVSGVFELSAWANMQIWNEGSFRQFEKCVGKGTGAVGVSTSDWDAEVMAELTTPIRLDLMCVGYLSTTTDFEVTASIAAKIGDAGFEFGGSAGQERTISGMVDFSERYDLY